MELASDGKINADGVITSNETITEKEGYKAMLYMLYAFMKNSGSRDLTDILSGSGYFGNEDDDIDRPIDTAYWEYWLEAVEKVKKETPPPLKELM